MDFGFKNGVENLFMSMIRTIKQNQILWMLDDGPGCAAYLRMRRARDHPSLKASNGVWHSTCSWRNGAGFVTHFGGANSGSNSSAGGTDFSQ